MLIQYTETRQCDLAALPFKEWPPEANAYARAILQAERARQRMAADLFPLQWLTAQVEQFALRQAEFADEFLPAAVHPANAWPAGHRP